MIIFEDESGFSLHPKLGRVWAKKGSKPYVWTRSQHQKRLNLFGWVAPFQGLHGMMKWPKGDTDGFINFLHRIVTRFRRVGGQQTTLTSSHDLTCKSSQLIDLTAGKLSVENGAPLSFAFATTTRYADRSGSFFFR
ncbi:MAG: transposase [Syntrophales bacterium LBB04]|nr:transposase [Syntrophales bacterium LBB04]